MSSKRKQKVAARRSEQQQYEQEEVEYSAPDPSTKISWPRHDAGKMDDSKFVVVWPSNFNSRKTIKNGRRVGLSDSCEDPIVQEMSEVCQYLKLRHVIEPYKALPRDLTAYPGRLRVELYDAEGKAIHDEVSSRSDLMRKMGTLIPKLNIRKQREAIQAKEREMRSMEAPSAAASGNKKKGKKKGRR